MKQATNKKVSLNGIIDNQTIEHIAQNDFCRIAETMQFLFNNAFVYGIEDNGDRWTFEQRFDITALITNCKSCCMILSQPNVDSDISITAISLNELEMLLFDICHQNNLQTNLDYLEELLIDTMFERATYPGGIPNKQLYRNAYYDYRIFKHMIVSYSNRLLP